MARGNTVHVNPKKLKAARGQWRRLSDVAKHFNWPRQQIYQWETGARPVPEKKLIALCQLYGIDRSQVMDAC